MEVLNNGTIDVRKHLPHLGKAHSNMDTVSNKSGWEFEAPHTASKKRKAKAPRTIPSEEEEEGVK